MKEIKVTKRIDCGVYYEEEDYFIQVDDDMYPILIKYTWHMHKCSRGFQYARTQLTRSVRSFLHSFVVGCAIKPNAVDHIDGNRNNCQRYNLQIVTQRQNAQNRFVDKGKLPGAHLNGGKSKVNPWMASIQVKDRVIHLGYFPDKVTAFFRYKEEVEKMGEFIQPYVLEKCYKIIDAEMVHI